MYYFLERGQAVSIFISHVVSFIIIYLQFESKKATGCFRKRKVNTLDSFIFYPKEKKQCQK